MKAVKFIPSGLLVMLLFTPLFSNENQPVIPAENKFLLVLLAGQSNMAGRGIVEEQDRQIHPRVLMQDKEGKWVYAVEPVHYDKKGAGVGPGRTFAILLAEQNPDMTIGLIPVACGGSPIEVWEPGKYWAQTRSYPYDDMLKRAGRAMKDGQLAAILWHQGESDTSPERAAVYAEKFNAFIVRMREDLNAEKVPLVIGQLSQYPQKMPWNTHKKMVDRAHRNAGAKPYCGFATSEELTPIADMIHFDAASMREFGRRYFEAYKKIKELEK